MKTKEKNYAIVLNRVFREICIAKKEITDEVKDFITGLEKEQRQNSCVNSLDLRLCIQDWLVIQTDKWRKIQKKLTQEQWDILNTHLEELKKLFFTHLFNHIEKWRTALLRIESNDPPSNKQEEQEAILDEAKLLILLIKNGNLNLEEIEPFKEQMHAFLYATKSQSEEWLFPKKVRQGLLNIYKKM